jgi:hypothetical protein
MMVLASIAAIAFSAFFGPGEVWSSPDGPGIPANLRTAISGKAIRLTWKAPLDHPELVTGYEVVRASLASGPFNTVSIVGQDTVTFLDTKAKPEVIYFYKIRATGKEEDSPYSPPVSAEISGLRPAKP